MQPFRWLNPYRANCCTPLRDQPWLDECRYSDKAPDCAKATDYEAKMISPRHYKIDPTLDFGIETLPRRNSSTSITGAFIGVEQRGPHSHDAAPVNLRDRGNSDTVYVMCCGHLVGSSCDVSRWRDRSS